MDKINLREEYKTKFELLSVNEVGLILYYFKCHKELVKWIKTKTKFKMVDNYYSKYSIRIHDILKGVK
jgi:hypothetical protein